MVSSGATSCGTHATPALQSLTPDSGSAELAKNRQSPETRRFCPCENTTPPSRSLRRCARPRLGRRSPRSSASLASTRTPFTPGSGAGGLGTPEIRELRQLREENAKLKQIVADLSLDRKMLQEIVAKTCEAGAAARTCRLSHEHTHVAIRRACAAINFNRATYYCKSKAGPLNAVLRERIKAIAVARIRYGYRRIGVLLRREGVAINDKRVYRLYAGEGLSLRAKLSHRRALRFPAPSASCRRPSTRSGA
jgi:hypothetical protein